MCPAGLPSLHFFCIKVTDVHINKGEKVQHRSSFAPVPGKRTVVSLNPQTGLSGHALCFISTGAESGP